jgi:protoheme ferro-lyase
MNIKKSKNIIIRIIAISALSLLIVSISISAGAYTIQDSPDKIGILMINHGEPSNYNATTYNDFKAFMEHMMNVGIIPEFLKHIDTGTILIDKKNTHWAPFWKRELIDAWGNEYKFAFFVPGNKKMDIPPHYLKIFGKGRDEPDIFEYAGLEAYKSWQEMGSHSPYRDQTVPQMEDVSEMFKEKYGDKVIIKFAYGFEHGNVENVTKELLERKIDVLIVAPQAVVGSYFEGTLHWIKEVHATLDEYALKNEKVPSFIETKQIGLQSEFIEGIVKKVREEISFLPSNANVAIFLSNHGFPVVKCGNYDCQSDPYHHYAKEIFDRVRDVIISNISWRGKLEVYQIYDESSEGDTDPNDEKMSPLEGLEYAKSHGFDCIIDIPYEFLGDCMDTLIGLREAFGIEPKWNNDFETEFDHDGVHVKITSSLYYPEYREKAYYNCINDEMEKLLGREEAKSNKENLGAEKPNEPFPIGGAVFFLILVISLILLLITMHKKNKRY